MTSTIEIHARPGGAPARPPSREVRVAVIGSGFAGLAMGIALKRRGEDDFVLLERGDDVGGTWRDNTYPGAACDVQSNLYSYSFAPNPDWPRSYSEQPEIQAYLQATADKFDVRRHCVFGADVTAARWDDDARRWLVTTSGRRVPGPRPDLRRRRAGRPDLPRHPRPGLLRRHGHALGPLGRRPRPDRRERRRHRHRRLGDPDRAGDPAQGRQPRRLPAHAGRGSCRAPTTPSSR